MACGGTARVLTPTRALVVALVLGRSASAEATQAEEECNASPAACHGDTALLQLPRLGPRATSQGDQCRDFAGWDGDSYGGGEHYTCLTYCQTAWCSKDSFQTPVMENGIPTYVEGKLDTYYTLKGMKRSPFMWPIVERLGQKESVIETAHEAAIMGMHYFTWDSTSARRALKASGYSKEDFPEYDLLGTFEIEDLEQLPQERIDACKKAGQVMGLSTWLMNEGTIYCDKVPVAVRDADRSLLNEHGEYVRDTWDWYCNNSSETKSYSISCKAGVPHVMLWDANYNGMNSKLITPKFNLPWDVACCCCGGGTSKLEPGSKMRFKVPAIYDEISAKLTEPSSDDALWDEYVNEEGYLNTKKHGWERKLYPKFNDSVEERATTKGLVATLPLTTFEPEEVAEYPYGPNSQTCSDYELEADILQFSLQYKGDPKEWSDWAAYTCRFSFYQRACSEDGTQEPGNLEMFGPIEQYFNGMIREDIAAGWTFEEGQKPNVSMEALRRADAWKVCCVCGGGRKKSGDGPKTVIDLLADSYYFK